MGITRVYEKVSDVLVIKNCLTAECEHKHSMTRIQTIRWKVEIFLEQWSGTFYPYRVSVQTLLLSLPSLLAANCAAKY